MGHMILKANDRLPYGSHAQPEFILLERHRSTVRGKSAEEDGASATDNGSPFGDKSSIRYSKHT